MKTHGRVLLLLCIIVLIIGVILVGKILLTDGTTYIREPMLRSIPNADVLGGSVFLEQADGLLLQGDYVLLTMADTRSMMPAFGANNEVITIKYEGQEINRGDIIIFDRADFDGGQHYNIIHRVVSTGSDAKGTYYYTQGDNRMTRDSYKIRKINIKYLAVGVIW